MAARGRSIPPHLQEGDLASEIVKVPFHGTVIHTTLLESEPHVVLRPTLEGMGLDYSAQLKKLKTRSWACVAETATRDAGVLKQTGAPRKQYRDLLWFTGSAWNVHPHAIPQLLTKLGEVRQELSSWKQIHTQLELDGVGRKGIEA